MEINHSAFKSLHRAPIWASFFYYVILKFITDLVYQTNWEEHLDLNHAMMKNQSVSFLYFLPEIYAYRYFLAILKQMLVHE